VDLTVKKLIENNLDIIYNDKLFWYASKIEIYDNSIKLFIENDNLVTFDNTDIYVKKISQLNRLIQNDGNTLFNVLISSGSFLFINDKQAVTQRQLTTQFDAGFWTTPAGRCDRNIYTTAIKETIEEIEISHNQNKLFPNIAENILITNENIKFYDISFENIKFPINLYDITVYLDNEIIEKTKMWYYYSQEVNTIEFRLPIFANMDEESLILTNPEFHTPTALMSIAELQKLQTVPALKKLIEELQNGK